LTTREVTAMTEKVLLVDDEAEFTEVLAERMTARGLRVDVADSGHAALELARQVFYDAVVLDLMMPGIDGLETLKRLLEINPDLQVILLTGHATLPQGIEAIKHGALEFMEKPVEMQLLLEKIGEAKEIKDERVEKRAAQDIDDILKSRGW
jgi:DNA-binding NtrC family response regulator